MLTASDHRLNVRSRYELLLIRLVTRGAFGSITSGRSNFLRCGKRDSRLVLDELRMQSGLIHNTD